MLIRGLSPPCFYSNFFISVFGQFSRSSFFGSKQFFCEKRQFFLQFLKRWFLIKNNRDSESLILFLMPFLSDSIYKNDAFRIFTEIQTTKFPVFYFVPYWIFPCSDIPDVPEFFKNQILKWIIGSIKPVISPVM